jgi:hypothetical protein
VIVSHGQVDERQGLLLGRSMTVVVRDRQHVAEQLVVDVAREHLGLAVCAE